MGLAFRKSRKLLNSYTQPVPCDLPVGMRSSKIVRSVATCAKGYVPCTLKRNYVTARIVKGCDLRFGVAKRIVRVVRSLGTERLCCRLGSRRIVVPVDNVLGWHGTVLTLP